MRFLHISDLHLGKRVNGFSMLDVQRDMLGETVRIAIEEGIEAVLIAGDIYDKTQPSAEAVTLFDGFLSELHRGGVKIFAVSGNHDSAERVAYGKRLFADEGVYLSKPYDGRIEPVRLEDEYGAIDVYLLPYIKPSDVRTAFRDEELEIDDYDGAVRTALTHIELDEGARNIIVAHQFVTGAQLSDSEEMSVGGLENVGADAFSRFDYAALGHIHRAQSMAGGRIRYCGTPLKYSLSEVRQNKSISVVDMREKGRIEIKEVPIKPSRDMRSIEGSFEELMSAKTPDSDDWLEIVLTDEREIPDAVRKLRLHYPNIMKLSYKNVTFAGRALHLEAVRSASPPELFSEFFAKVNGRELSSEQSGYIDRIMREISEGMQ